jgi:acetyl/propionyl-CoA carboxylase alpha subunit
MIQKLLIANRGEIACRIIKTCREIGISTVAVFSDADRNAKHVQQADEAVHIGGSPAGESYLNMEKILAVAHVHHVDAIHPGYGFLAENATFAQAVMDAGLVWVGATPQSIIAMGDKRQSKLILNDIPLISGYQSEDQSDEVLIQASQEIGFPIMVKASAGGGGKGMRRVNTLDALPDALQAARREAKQAFGDDTLILEKFVVNPRHIEVQILGDRHGTIHAIGERECSIQRRHQKIVEETPSPAVDAELREKLCQTAVSIGQQLNYVGAGTIEFLLDENKNFYFMEMNTRLQVEHPVTEMVYGVDLVAWQIRIAEGGALPLEPFQANGHAIEVRVYAEDPQNDFLPATGTIHVWEAPQNIRVDDGIQSGDEISIFYDPMIAKIITHAPTRSGAVRKMSYALSETLLFGVKNNIRYLTHLFEHPDFISGDIHTGFIEQYPSLGEEPSAISPAVWIACGIQQLGGHYGWHLNRERPVQHKYSVGDEVITISTAVQRNHTINITTPDASYQVTDVQGDSFIADGVRYAVRSFNHQDQWWLHHDGRTVHLTWQDPLPVPQTQAQNAGSLRAPMPGQVIRVAVEVGQTVAEGDLLMVLEAMKMEHRIEAPQAGTVKDIYYQIGDTVQADTVLLDVE